MALVGTVKTKWGRVEIHKSGLTFKPIAISERTGKRVEFPDQHALSDALDLAHKAAKSQVNLSQADRDFLNVDGDTSIGQNVNKDWKEQNDLNMIDLIEQKMNGGIKPMSEQFPGEHDGIMDPKDLFESDMIQSARIRTGENMKLEKLDENVEKKLAGSITIKPHPKDILDLTPEEIKKIKSRFEDAKKPASNKPQPKDVQDEWGHGYNGGKKKMSFDESVEKKLSSWSAASGGGIKYEKNGKTGIVKKEGSSHTWSVVDGSGKVLASGKAEDEWDARDKIVSHLGR